MNKLGAVLIVIAVVATCYLILLVVMPVVNDIIITANATMTTDVDDLSAYPGAQDVMVSAPWWLFFVPGTIGMIVIVAILKLPAR